MLSELTLNLLRDSGNLVANLFIDLWKYSGIKANISLIGFYKRSGTAVNRHPAILLEIAVLTFFPCWF